MVDDPSLLSLCPGAQPAHPSRNTAFLPRPGVKRAPTFADDGLGVKCAAPAYATWENGFVLKERITELTIEFRRGIGVERHAGREWYEGVTAVAGKASRLRKETFVLALTLELAAAASMPRPIAVCICIASGHVQAICVWGQRQPAALHSQHLPGDKIN